MLQNVTALAINMRAAISVHGGLMAPLELIGFTGKPQCWNDDGQETEH